MYVDFFRSMYVIAKKELRKTCQLLLGTTRREHERPYVDQQNFKLIKQLRSTE